MISMIACVGKNFELGLKGDMPWGMEMKGDLQHFKEVTTGHPVVMGTKTYFSIGRPLPKRTNIIITRNVEETTKKINQKEVVIFGSVNEVLDYYQANQTEHLFVIGGAEIYQLFLPYAQQVYLTEIDQSFEADTYFPLLKQNEWEKNKIKNGIIDHQSKYPHTFYLYKRKNRR